MEIGSHRPRNVGWARAAALLYGDWGTSKAYVIGAAFLACTYASFPIILAVCALTALVGYNYVIICRHFPDGGGVYSSARLQSRLLAVVGSLLLVADLTVTASLSGWSAMAYFHFPKLYIAEGTVGLILLVAAINVYGPKHSGTMAVGLALPTVAVVVLTILFSLPHLTWSHLETSHKPFTQTWTSFVGVILALSGVEAIANLTGVMKLDPDASPEKPAVGKTARKSIFLVALEVVFGTAMLGWAMLSLSPSLKAELVSHWDDMLTLLATHYGTMALGPTFGNIFGVVTAIIIGLLLLSAVNTAVVALIGLVYLLARDGEMPQFFTRLNRFGVPAWPLVIATILPIVVVVLSPDQISLMELYAIGVVGAITVNLGSCVLNRKLDLVWRERALMTATAVILLAVEFTLAKTKPNALFFITCILIIGLALRAYAQRKTGMQGAEEAEASFDTAMFRKSPAGQALATPDTGVSAIMVAARGITPVLKFALEEAQLRKASLYVLYLRTVAVNLPTSNISGNKLRWQNDRQAAEIMYTVFELNGDRGVPVIPVYAVSEGPAGTILDMAATLGVDMLVLGAPHRSTLASLLKGDVVTEVAAHLPDSIKLVIYG